jgi:RNA polymerase sigma-70 factor (ECF subfamily)
MYRAHHQVIWRTLRRLGFSPEAAADYTQQAYLIALERLDDVLVGSEKAFLFSTAIRLGRTAARKLRRMDLTDDVDLGSDMGGGAEWADSRQVALQLLERVLAHLDVDLVTVFTLYEIEGMSSPEIAEMLDIPLGTVASRLRRARETFREKAARLERIKPQSAGSTHPPHVKGGSV